MNDEQIKQIIEDNYDVSREDTIWTMVSDLYNRKSLSVIIVLWIWFIFFMAALVYSGIKFFKTEQTKFQIMYAALFTCCFQGICLMKIFAWQMIHRQGIKREIKELKK